jgi:hypothetical protein
VTVDIAERTIPTAPPATTAQAVRQHRAALEKLRDELKAGIAALALASARKEPGASEALAALRQKIVNLEFEIECNSAAHELAATEDEVAFAAWRAAVATLEPEQAIEGIGKEVCPARCLRNQSCVMLASNPHVASTCCHPILARDLVFTRDSQGERQFSFDRIPQASRIFEAACRKLKIAR